MVNLTKACVFAAVLMFSVSALAEPDEETDRADVIIKLPQGTVVAPTTGSPIVLQMDRYALTHEQLGMCVACFDANRKLAAELEDCAHSAEAVRIRDTGADGLLPWWAWTVAGVVVGGTGTYLLTR